MNLSSLATKGVLIKGAGSLTVLSGASVGGYYISQANFYKSKSIDSEIPRIDLRVDAKGTHRVDMHPCSKDFFGENLNTYFYPNKDVSVSLPSSVPTNESNPEGCVIMRMSENSSNNNEWSFELESAIKRDKIGILFKLEANTNKKDNLKYSVFFLEQDKDEWKIKGGFIAKKLKEKKVTLQSPDKTTINKTFDSSGVSDSLESVSSWKNTFYQSTWSCKNGGSDELLKYKFGPDENSSDLIGISGNSISESFIYMASNFSGLFKHFENKKGTWSSNIWNNKTGT